MSILGSIVNISWRGPISPSNEHENLHFDMKQDIHTSSKNYEESGYGLSLDLLTISY